MEIVWRVSGRCSFAVWRVSGRCLKGVYTVKKMRRFNFYRKYLPRVTSLHQISKTAISKSFHWNLELFIEVSVSF